MAIVYRTVQATGGGLANAASARLPNLDFRRLNFYVDKGILQFTYIFGSIAGVSPTWPPRAILVLEYTVPCARASTCSVTVV